VNKADVYRKAAEVIVRDGKYEGGLTEHGDGPQHIKSGEGAVCALGACARAEYELYGTLPMRSNPWGTSLDPYTPYDFGVLWGDWTNERAIFRINDSEKTSAEDIALLLKKRAEEIDDD
jgi:hypothetical protein